MGCCYRFSCVRETENHRYPFSVAVVRSGVTVGHVPRKISSTCSLFLRQGGMIDCRVTGQRRYSEDLSQGGMEIPCILTLSGYRGNLKFVVQTESDKEEQTPQERIKFCSSICDIDKITSGEMLSDIPVNLAQQLLKKHFQV